MCREIVASDLNHAKRHALLKRHGYTVEVGHEN
jgi:GDPmannose 4,6-dehydratase